MVEADLKTVLLALGEAELIRIGRISDRLLAGRPELLEGARPRHRRSGRGTDFLDYQPYRPGTDLRAVDWRASARSADPVIRRYLHDASAEWFICLDRSASMAVGTGAKYRLAVQLSAAFAFLLLKRGHRLGLMLFSGDIDTVLPPGRGRSHFGRAMALLAATAPLVEGGGSRLGRCGQRIGRSTSVVVISDFLAEDGLASDFERLRRRGCEAHALCVGDPAECMPPALGPVEIRDVERGERRFILAADGAGDQVARTLESLRDGLARRLAGQGVVFTGCTTAETWQRVMVGHLRRAADRVSA
jgi:uncharacterized protein (DUF58 family)